jgi:ribosomal protein S18 acetylase RimI-like enzyme
MDWYVGVRAFEASAQYQPMEVRPVRDERDVRELTVAHARAWRTAYTDILSASVIEDVADPDPTDERIRSQYARLTGKSKQDVQVVEDDCGTVRGYAVFRWAVEDTNDSVRTNEAELKELYIDPEYWDQGFGTALLETGIGGLPSETEGIALETLAGNEVGISFYERRGFERAGTASFEAEGEQHQTLVYRKSLE